MTQLQPKDRNIGMVFQSYALYPHLKVIDNIAFPLKQKGHEARQSVMKRRARLPRCCKSSICSSASRPSFPAVSSSAFPWRARWSKEPDVLLLDEPMSNLDARLKIEIRDEIRRVRQETGITSIIVTHDQEEAMAIADKIAILDNGRIQQYDTPEHVYHYPANLFVAKFMGNPADEFHRRGALCGRHACGRRGLQPALEQHMAQGGKRNSQVMRSRSACAAT